MANSDLTPVTTQRIADAFELAGWGVSPRLDDPRMLQGHFDGHAVIVATQYLPVFTLIALSTERPLPRDRYEEAVAWCEHRNATTHFGTMGINLPEEGEGLVGCSVTVPMDAGVDDDQLRHHLELALSCAVVGVRDFWEDFS